MAKHKNKVINCNLVSTVMIKITFKSNREIVTSFRSVSSDRGVSDCVEAREPSKI